MSYILDALKKSDHERQRRATPGVHTSHNPEAPRPRRSVRWPYVLTAALLLNVGLLLWVLHPWSPEQTTPAAQSKASEQEAREQAAALSTKDPVPDNPPASADRSPNSPTSKPAKVEVKPSPAAKADPPQSASAVSEAPAASLPQVASGSVKSEEKKTAPTPEAKPPAKRAQEDSESIRETQAFAMKSPSERREELKRRQRERAGFNGPDSVPSAPPRIPPAQPVQPLPGRQPALEPTGAAEAPMVAAAPREAPQSAPQAPAIIERRPPLGKPAPDKSIPAMRELPQGSRPDSISISMLVYSETPSERMVNVNGKMMREGQEVSAGLKLESITPNGVVFNYQGARFKKDVF